MRARKKKWAAGELCNNELLISEPRTRKGEWNAYFGNSNALRVEIGCGKGRFITETARCNPDINFVEVERERQVIISGLRRARELGIKNIGFVLADASELMEIFGENEIERLYINFCDPWPNKKKWAKRRLTHENFLNVYKPLLNGRLCFKTDNSELFDFSLGQFEKNGWAVENISIDLYAGQSNEAARDTMTEYEEKFFLSGVPIMSCEAYPNGGDKP